MRDAEDSRRPRSLKTPERSQLDDDATTLADGIQLAVLRKVTSDSRIHAEPLRHLGERQPYKCNTPYRYSTHSFPLLK